MPQGSVGMAPGVEHATMGAGRQRPFEIGEMTDALLAIDADDNGRDRILPRNEAPRDRVRPWPQQVADGERLLSDRLADAAGAQE